VAERHTDDGQLIYFAVDGFFVLSDDVTGRR
jgi:hypothetical protein